MLKELKTTSNAGRFKTGIDYKSLLTTKEPFKALTIGKRAGGGRSMGTITMRNRSAGHKRLYRVIDFKRNKADVPGKVVTVEYDPNRTSFISLVNYADGDKRYILTPEGINVGDTVVSGARVEIRVGNTTSLKVIPVGANVHNVELFKGRGGQILRSAGTYATIQSREPGFVVLKMPSGEIRRVPEDNLATIGVVSNGEWKNVNFGKAGRKRLMGIKPHNRGVAMNPNDHPHGGGEGKSGIGMSTPKTRWGRPAVGKTRKKNARSNRFIIKDRKRGKH